MLLDLEPLLSSLRENIDYELIVDNSQTEMVLSFKDFKSKVPSNLHHKVKLRLANTEKLAEIQREILRLNSHLIALPLLKPSSSVLQVLLPWVQGKTLLEVLL